MVCTLYSPYIVWSDPTQLCKFTSSFASPPFPLTRPVPRIGPTCLLGALLLSLIKPGAQRDGQGVMFGLPTEATEIGQHLLSYRNTWKHWWFWLKAPLLSLLPLPRHQNTPGICRWHYSAWCSAPWSEEDTLGVLSSKTRSFQTDQGWNGVWEGQEISSGLFPSFQPMYFQWGQHGPQRG